MVENPRRQPLAEWEIACWMAAWCAAVGRHLEAEHHLWELLSIVVVDKPQWSPA